MKPIDFYMGKVANWEDVSFEPAKIKEIAGLPAALRIGLPKTAVAIEASSDLMRFGVAKAVDGVLKIGSLFGCYDIALVDFPKDSLNKEGALSLICVGADGYGSANKITVSSEWMLAKGRNPDLSLQVRMRGDGKLAPTCSSWVFRGASGFEEGIDVFLPSLPSKVKKAKDGAEIDCSGLKFIVSGYPESRLVLEGKVQWYVPNQKSVFEKST